MDLSLQYPQSVYTTVPFVVSENLVPQLPLPAVILHNVRSRSFWAWSYCELHLDIKAVERLYSPSLLKPVCTNCSDESGLLSHHQTEPQPMAKQLQSGNSHHCCTRATALACIKLSAVLCHDKMPGLLTVSKILKVTFD